MSPAPQKPRKRKTPDNKENASPEKTKLEMIRKVRDAWIASKHLCRVPTNKENMKVAPAARKQKIYDSKKKAPAEKTKSEKMPKMRNAWIDTPTEEKVWQIMPTLVREEGGSVATLIERSDGTLKCSHV
jgi:hypothetical protein